MLWIGCNIIARVAVFAFVGERCKEGLEGEDFTFALSADTEDKIEPDPKIFKIDPSVAVGFADRCGGYLIGDRIGRKRVRDGVPFVLGRNILDVNLIVGKIAVERKFASCADRADTENLDFEILKTFSSAV